MKYVDTPIGMSVEKRVGMAAHQILNVGAKIVGMIVDKGKEDSYVQELRQHYPSLQVLDMTEAPLGVADTVLIRIAPVQGGQA